MSTLIKTHTSTTTRVPPPSREAAPETSAEPQETLAPRDHVAPRVTTSRNPGRDANAELLTRMLHGCADESAAATMARLVRDGGPALLLEFAATLGPHDVARAATTAGATREQAVALAARFEGQVARMFHGAVYDETLARLDGAITFVHRAQQPTGERAAARAALTDDGTLVHALRAVGEAAPAHRLEALRAAYAAASSEGEREHLTHQALATLREALPALEAELVRGRRVVARQFAADLSEQLYDFAPAIREDVALRVGVPLGHVDALGEREGTTLLERAVYRSRRSARRQRHVAIGSEGLLRAGLRVFANHYGAVPARTILGQGAREDARTRGALDAIGAEPRPAPILDIPRRTSTSP